MCAKDFHLTQCVGTLLVQFNNVLPKNVLTAISLKHRSKNVHSVFRVGRSCLDNIFYLTSKTTVERRICTVFPKHKTVYWASNENLPIKIKFISKQRILCGYTKV